MVPKLRYVGFGIIAALALYGWGRRDARLSRELANWKQAAQHALQARTAYRFLRLTAIYVPQALPTTSTASTHALDPDIAQNWKGATARNPISAS